VGLDATPTLVPVTAPDRSHPSKDRSRLSFKLRYAVRYPRRVLPYGRRWVRDRRFGMRTRDHVSYYRAIMRSNASRSPDLAVGGHTHELWLRHGRMQFDYLFRHGLDPAMRVLEIGCGNLRAGRLIVDYLDVGNYYGVDISPDILLAALDTVALFGLQTKLPRLTLVQDLKLNFLPTDTFDVVNAHSVFSHSPIEVIDECLRHVGRIMTQGGFFDFTFNRTDGTEHQVLREDFYYRTATLIALAANYGLQARFMDDWGPLSAQSKLRVTRSASPSVAV
jgi:SAM-dependent methyltransferase